jgi:hypothetical protein
MSPVARLLLSGSLYAVPLAAQFGEILAVTPTPPGLTAVGIEHNGLGALLMTGIGAVDTVSTVTPGGLVLGAWPAVASGNPIGVTTDGAFVYVTDTVGDDVDVYTLAGAPVFSFPVASTFPEGITFNAATGTLFVVDPIAGAMLEYTVFGAPLGVFPLLGFSIDGCAWDPLLGGYWVYDSGTDLVRHYSAAFVELENFPGPIAAGYTAGEGVAVIGPVLYVVSTVSGVVIAYDIADGMPVGATATFELAGAGCPSPTVVHEAFPAGTFDLAGASVLFTPNGTGGYTVTPGVGPFVLPVAPPLPMGDDTVVPGLPLPFLFPHPGGVTAAVNICSNGYVWLTPNSVADYTPTVAEFLDQTPRLAPLWMDLNPTVAGTVHFDVTPAAVLITWFGVAEFGAPASLNFAQLAMFPGGAFEYRYLAAGNIAAAALVGYAPGPDALPGAVDYSLVPFDTGVTAAPLRLGRVTRPVLGGIMVASVSDIPPGTALGVLMLGLVEFAPPLPLDGIGAPGCGLQQTVDATVPFPVPGPAALVPFAIPPIPALAGFVFYAQAATASPGFNPLGLLTSNGATLTLGL